MCSAMPGRHQSHLCGPKTTSVATTASQIVISPTTTAPLWASTKPCSHHNTVMCPHPTSVATENLLCGPQATHVATTASCWSSTYPCSYHNFLLVFSESVKPKSPLCGPHSLPLSPTKKLDGPQTTPVSS